MSNATRVGETMVAFGGVLKSLGGGRYRGPLVLFSGPDDPDLAGDYFTKDTDFGLEDGAGRSFVLYDHNMGRSGAPTELAGNPFKGKKLGRGALSIDDVAVWLEFTLDLRGQYEDEVAKRLEKSLKGLIDAGKLGLSSGTAAHLIERVEQANGTAWLKSWPLGLDASLTPTPCEPRTTVVPLKSLMDAAAKGLDYDDSFRDSLAAQAAVETLSRMLLGCVGECFGWYSSDGEKPPKAERLARMRAEFEDFADDSLAVIAALMDDGAGGAAKAMLDHLKTEPGGVRPFRDTPPMVVSAVEGFRDLSRKFAEGRRAEGRPTLLGEAKRDAIRSLVDGVSPLIDDLRALLASEATAAPADDVKARLRQIQLNRIAARSRDRTHGA